MFISPNLSSPYRNWAYCCVAVRDLSRQLEAYSAGKIICMGDYYRIKASGREAYNGYCRKKCQVLRRKISLYAGLRDRIAACHAGPERHLFQVQDILQMAGNVIDITPRHSREKVYHSLLKCSPDGTCLDECFDAYKLLAFGYGK